MRCSLGFEAGVKGGGLVCFVGLVLVFRYNCRVQLKVVVVMVPPDLLLFHSHVVPGQSVCSLGQPAQSAMPLSDVKGQRFRQQVSS